MSFFTSLSGMRNAETDLRVISNNIANAETAGFKKSNAAFSDLVATGSTVDPRPTPGIGAAVSSINQDFTLGSLEQTGRARDLATNSRAPGHRWAGGIAGCSPAAPTTAPPRS